MNRVARSSLAATFAPGTPQDNTTNPDRSSALAGLLPVRAIPVTPPASARDINREPATTEGTAAANGTQDRPAQRAVTRPRERAHRTATTSEDLNRVRNVAFYLPPDLLDRLRRTARSRELTYADLLTEAAAAHLNTIAGAFTAPQNVVQDGAMPRRQTRPKTEPAVQRQMRLDGHQLAWLDQQVTLLDAPSRNAVVVALLRAHVGPVGLDITPAV